MKLEMKYLAGYLPYGLEIRYIERNETHNLEYHNIMSICCDQNHLKPILRPLSDLTKEIEINGEKFVPHIKLGGRPNLKDYDIDYLSKHINHMSYGLIQKLIEWHFDIYGLIEAGLAIDINTLNK